MPVADVYRTVRIDLSAQRVLRADQSIVLEVTQDMSDEDIRQVAVQALLDQVEWDIAEQQITRSDVSSDIDLATHRLDPDTSSLVELDPALPPIDPELHHFSYMGRTWAMNDSVAVSLGVDLPSRVPMGTCDWLDRDSGLTAMSRLCAHGPFTERHTRLGEGPDGALYVQHFRGLFCIHSTVAELASSYEIYGCPSSQALALTHHGTEVAFLMGATFERVASQH